LPALAQPAQPGSASPSKNNYADAASWLCRPGRAGDACAVDLTATVVAADGHLTKESWAADPNAPIDCFYVYPTVSTDREMQSDMRADPAERTVVRLQFARFASKCRPYAPMYRQVTLAGLRSALGGGGASLDRGVGYQDVRDAWNYYLEHDNGGRGVVLIGHSQGAGVLAELLKREIDGRPVQSRIVSAFLLGSTIQVPRGKDVGGTFQKMPLCRSASQTGCIVTYASFRTTVPPPANSLFGRGEGETVGACTNPAALSGGSGALRPYFATDGTMVVGAPQPRSWVAPAKAIETPFVTLPGLIGAKCATNEHASYLEVTVNSSASDPRVDDISGDIGAPGNVQANWGLHLVDVDLAIGNLVELVGEQAKAYARK
jgi:hypothetical protein